MALPLALAGCANTGGNAASPPGDPCEWPLAESTATSSVSMLRCDFTIPQLDRARRVWIYLPPGYATGDVRYPVLYMHDGQNVFDAATSYAGEWGVDEALDSLVEAGLPGVIVVAVANGEERRLDEYSPWRNERLDAGGEGEEYVDFLVETLKPYIDANYRTLPDRTNTGIAGSSMGGLISLYAVMKAPETFGLAGVFSPAFWFAPDVYELVAGAASPGAGTRVYMVTGGREEPDPAVYVEGHERMVGVLGGPALADDVELHAVVRPEGTHSEGFWRREFPAAYRWLFARETAGGRK